MKTAAKYMFAWLGIAAVLAAIGISGWWLVWNATRGEVKRSVKIEEDAASVLPDSFYTLDFSHVVAKGPYVRSESAILVDYDSGAVLYAKDPNQLRPIASISKLVSAMVVLDHVREMYRTQTVTKEDAYRSSKSRIPSGSTLTLYDLLQASLMASDNRATRALARAVCGTLDSFAVEMNAKVKELGLTQTHFVEPTGLNHDNVSTAHEVAKILHFAYAYPRIAKITSQKHCSITIKNRRKRVLTLANTNRLIFGRGQRVLAGKTGYISESAHCLATLVQANNGERLALVVLGVPGDKLRFREAKRLVDWGVKHSDLRSKV